MKIKYSRRNRESSSFGCDSFSNMARVARAREITSCPEICKPRVRSNPLGGQNTFRVIFRASTRGGTGGGTSLKKMSHTPPPRSRELFFRRLTSEGRSHYGARNSAEDLAGECCALEHGGRSPRSRCCSVRLSRVIFPKPSRLHFLPTKMAMCSPCKSEMMMLIKKHRDAMNSLTS